MLQPRPAIAILVLLAFSGVGKAQTSVSASSGGLAHDCFIAALRSTQTGASVKDGVTGCSAALAGPLTAEARAATYDNCGILYDADKNYSSAWSDFNTAIRINPALGDPYLNRGVALIRLHRAEEALADIKKGMSLGASLPQIGYYDLAVAEENLGQFTQAYYNYKLSEAADPMYAPTQRALKNFAVKVTRALPAADVGTAAAPRPLPEPVAPAPTAPPATPAQPPAAVAPPAAVSASASSPVESVTVWGYKENPDGKGDPDAITCRKPQQLPGSRLYGAATCKTNAQWAAIRKAGLDVTPDGRGNTESEKSRSLNPPVCISAAGMENPSNAMQATFSPMCF